MSKLCRLLQFYLFVDNFLKFLDLLLELLLQLVGYFTVLFVLHGIPISCISLDSILNGGFLS